MLVHNGKQPRWPTGECVCEPQYTHTVKCCSAAVCMKVCNTLLSQGSIAQEYVLDHYIYEDEEEAELIYGEKHRNSGGLSWDLSGEGCKENLGGDTYLS